MYVYDLNGEGNEFQTCHRGTLTRTSADNHGYVHAKGNLVEKIYESTRCYCGNIAKAHYIMNSSMKKVSMHVRYSVSNL